MHRPLVQIVPPTEESVKARLARRTPKAVPSADRFVEVPLSVVESVGLRSERGPKAKMAKPDLAVLAGAAWFYKENVGRERPVPLETGDVVHLDATTIMLSMETVARNLFLRWYGRGPVDGEGKPFYYWIKAAFERVERAGEIVRVGHPLGRPRARLGVLWSFEGTAIGAAIDRVNEVPAPPALLTALPATPSDPAAEAAPFEREGLVNVIDLLGGIYAGERALTEGFTDALVSEATNRPRRRRKYYHWSKKKARQGEVWGEHGTTGLFRPDDFVDGGAELRAGAPAFGPYLVLEIDRYSTPPATRGVYKGAGPAPLDVEAIEEAAGAARRFVRALVALGADARHVSVCFSGNRSVHVYVPAGMYGAPVFWDADDMKGALARLVASILDEGVDEAALSPRQLVRAVGSRREETGVYKLAIPGDEFLQMTPLGLVDRSVRFAPSSLRGPLAVAPVPELVRLALRAVEAKGKAKGPYLAHTNRGVSIDDVESWPAIYRRALKGCVDGEEWYPGYSGRDQLIFNLACFLLERADEEEVFALLERVNARNEPPLSPAQLRAKVRSAKKTIGKAS